MLAVTTWYTDLVDLSGSICHSSTRAPGITSTISSLLLVGPLFSEETMTQIL